MSCSVHDGIELEARGIRSVAIHTAVFINSAVAHARAFGRPDFEPVPIRHPIAGLTPEEVNERVDEIMPTIVGLLTGRNPQ